ncbi:unnamed protein product [Oikopleura dioica]|uniref:Uncharacterized protein n=1 Tax=Oikopleura dioica TaxID=34765 RepID=E4YRU9_OIKDI|nr:unnamed protein product [Oikopleura dioica]
MKPTLRSGASGLVKTELPPPALVEEQAKELAEFPLANKEESSGTTLSAVEATANVMEEIVKDGPITTKEALSTLAMSLKVRQWAKRLLETVEDTGPSLEAPKPPKTASLRETESELVQAIKDIMEDSDNLNDDDELTHPVLDRLALLISRVLELQGGTKLRLLFRFNVTSLASYYTNGPESEEQTIIRKNDGITNELRDSVGLVNKLYKGRGSANGGLTMRDIVSMHASAAMEMAWTVLSTLTTSVDVAFDRDNRWKSIVRAVENYVWHSCKAGFEDFHRIAMLRSWLADAKGPRLQDVATRLLNLRSALFPTGTMEVQDPDSYDAYGLQELDDLTFENWERQATRPLENHRALDLATITRDDDDADARVSAPPAKKARHETGEPGPSGLVSNTVIDRLVRNLMTDEESALRDDYSLYF